MGRRKKGQLTPAQKRRIDAYIKKHKAQIIEHGFETYYTWERTPAGIKKLYAAFRTQTIDKMDNDAKFAGNNELLGWAMKKTLRSRNFAGDAGIMKSSVISSLRNAGLMKKFHKLTRNQKFDEHKLTQVKVNRSQANGIRSEYRYEYRKGKVIYITLYYEDGEGRWELTVRDN